MIDLEKLKSEISSEKIILTFTGVLNENQVNELLSEAEAKLKSRQVTRPIQKKVFSVVLEGLQNSLKHGKFMKASVPTTLFLIEAGSETFDLIIGNEMSQEQRSRVESKLEAINIYSAEELHEAYRAVLQNGKQSEIGGSGLGLMDMAKRTGNKFEYNFESVGSDRYYFTLKIKI